MYSRLTLLCALTVLLALLLASRLSLEAHPEGAVRPSRVERLTNLEVSATNSNQLAYLPQEWGRLVAVQRLDALSHMLFLQAENGDIFPVRLTQRGNYLYLDTSDRGGVATVIKREP